MQKCADTSELNVQTERIFHSTVLMALHYGVVLVFEVAVLFLAAVKNRKKNNSDCIS